MGLEFGHLQVLNNCYAAAFPVRTVLMNAASGGSTVDD